MEIKCIERAAVDPMQIIRAQGPESSDAHCNRRLDKKVVVVSARRRRSGRAEVIGSFVAAVEAEEETLEEPLLNAAGDIRHGVILIGQNG
jgi:hypothetical protein